MAARRPHERRFPRQRGLTLVEIMVVIAILAIIAAIAIPIYSNYIKDAKIGRAEGNLVLLSTLMGRSGYRLPISPPHDRRAVGKDLATVV